jgi:hypothetical protein
MHLAQALQVATGMTAAFVRMAALLLVTLSLVTRVALSLVMIVLTATAVRHAQAADFEALGVRLA